MGTEQQLYEQIWEDEDEENFRIFSEAQHNTDTLIKQYEKDIEEVDYGEDVSNKIRNRIKNFCEVSNSKRGKERITLSKITERVLRDEREHNPKN